MPKKESKPPGYWTFERVREEAKRYKTLAAFRKGSNSAYQRARRKKWLPMITGHMTSKCVPKGHWNNKANVLNEAKKYSTRTEFARGSPGAYEGATRNSWLEEACAEMESGYELFGERTRIWTFDGIAKAAEQCETRKEFNERFASAYVIACRKDWIDDVCSHMRPSGEGSHRTVYALVAMDRSWLCYVGTAVNVAERYRDHLTRKRLRSAKRVTERRHKLIILEKNVEFVDNRAAEQRGIDYMIDRGWEPTNKSPPGSAGKSTRVYSKKRVLRDARKCRTKKEFEKQFRGSWVAARRNKWYDEATAHMVSGVKLAAEQKRKWTKEAVAEAALSYETRGEFNKGNTSAYQAARNNDWLDDVCEHMRDGRVESREKRRKWTFEAVEAEAKKYPNRRAFDKGSPGASQAARNKGWYEKVCAHMPRDKRHKRSPNSDPAAQAKG